MVYTFLSCDLLVLATKSVLVWWWNCYGTCWRSSAGS